MIPPVLNLSHFLVISDDPELAEEVCSHFRRPGFYVLLLEAPNEPLNSHGHLEKSCQFVVNAIAQTGVTTVLFAGCPTRSKEIIQRMVKGTGLEVLNYKGCESIQALSVSSRLAMEVDPSLRDGQSHLIAIEEGHQFSAVIARNLAVACHSRLATIPHVSVARLNDCVRDWRDWSISSGFAMDDAKDRILRLIGEQIAEIRIDVWASVTFISIGIPYGIWSFDSPVTHLPIKPSLGLTVINGLLKSLSAEMRCPVVILLDPSKTDHSERQTVFESFRAQNYLICQAVGQSATAMAASYLIEFMPSDAVFLSTHCGEVRGQLVTESLMIASGEKHTFRYERVVSGFRSPNPDLFEVKTLIRPVSLDGVSWFDSAHGDRSVAKQIMELVLTEEVSKADDSKRRLISATETGVVQFSDSLQMADLLYSPDPIVVGGMMHPIIFNNACSSARELASKFIAAGASCYIGTTRDTADSLAAEVARSFAQSASRGSYIPLALHEAQNAFANDLGYNPYLVYGYVFAQLIAPPPIELDDFVEDRILEAIEGQKAVKPQNPNHKHQIEGVIRFLESELVGLRSQRAVSTTRQ